MAKSAKSTNEFNVFIVGQNGRLTYEAVLFAASLRHFDPDFSGRLFVAEPQAGPTWPADPRMTDAEAIALLTGELGAEILPFKNVHFGQTYAQGNKIEALLAMPRDEPFIFFDTDTLITGPLSAIPFDFDRPSASLRVSATWPEPQLYGVGYTDIWRSLYDRFDLDFSSSLDLREPDEYWRRYLYFNAGWFFHRCPHEFGARFLDYALAIRQEPGPELAAQSLDPWLDQITLPLVIHSLGGERQTIPPGLLDGETSCHYRTMPLLFARESEQVITALNSVSAPNKIKKLLKQYEPMKRFIYQNRGQKVRDMFDQNKLPLREKTLRNQIKKAGLWMR